MRIVSFNCCSLIHSGRTLELHDELGRSHVRILGLQGTRLPHHGDVPVLVSSVGGYRFFSWGFGRGKFTNRACGVSISVVTEVAHGVVAVYSPPPCIQGRAGAIRIKDSFSDVVIINLYLDPKANVGNGVAKQANKQVLD